MRTWSPDTIVLPMDEPSASTHSGRPSDAAARRAAAMRQGCTVDIADVATRVEGADGDRATALASVFGWLPSAETPPVLRVVFGPELPAVPDRAPDEAYGPAVRVWRAGEVLTVADGADLVAVATPADVRVGGAPSKAIRHVAPLALGHMLGFHRRFVLHAGVIERAARVALVPGESGRGKSSVVAAAQAAGWEALGDDTVILGGDGPTVSVSTLGLPLLFPGELVLGGLPGSEPVGDDPRGRHTFPAPPPRWRGVTHVVVPAAEELHILGLTPVYRDLAYCVYRVKQ